MKPQQAPWWSVGAHVPCATDDHDPQHLSPRSSCKDHRSENTLHPSEELEARYPLSAVLREGVAADGVEACLGRHGKIAIFLTPAVARITSPTREKEGVAAERTGST